MFWMSHVSYHGAMGKFLLVSSTDFLHSWNSADVLRASAEEALNIAAEQLLPNGSLTHLLSNSSLQRAVRFSFSRQRQLWIDAGRGGPCVTCRGGWGRSWPLCCKYEYHSRPTPVWIRELLIHKHVWKLPRFQRRNESSWSTTLTRRYVFLDG